MVAAEIVAFFVFKWHNKKISDLDLLTKSSKLKLGYPDQLYEQKKTKKQNKQKFCFLLLDPMLLYSRQQ